MIRFLDLLRFVAYVIIKDAVTGTEILIYLEILQTSIYRIQIFTMLGFQLDQYSERLDRSI